MTLRSTLLGFVLVFVLSTPVQHPAMSTTHLNIEQAANTKKVEPSSKVAQRKPYTKLHMRLVERKTLINEIARSNAKTRDELICLATNIYFEAKGEPLDGVKAVGQVTLNRVKMDDFENSICGVVYQPNQFSWVNQANLKKFPTDKKHWLQAQRVAYELHAKKSNLGLAGYSHFLNPELSKKLNGGKLPEWYLKAKAKRKIGNHVFVKV